MTKYHLPPACALLFATLGLAISSVTVAHSEEPGNRLPVQLSKFKDLEIHFRFCPAGDIYPGRPVSTPEGTDPQSIREFYIGETEVTLSQYRTVMGESGMDALQKEAGKQTAIPELLKAAQEGQQEPAFLIGLDDAVDFCNRLQIAFNEDRALQPDVSIESRGFRLPSHVEWQYAARAIPSAKNEGQRPHFGRWVTTDQLSPASQEKCREIWKSLGQQNEFPGDQESFMLLSGAKESELAKFKDVLAEIFQKAFQSAPRTAAGTGRLSPVGQTTANEWGLQDMHESVSEWTIWARDRDRMHSLWDRMIEQRHLGKSLDGQEDVFLSGGSFSDTYYAENALARFTIWGGPKLADGKQPVQFAYNRSEQVANYTPGFRVVMERMLDKDWLYLVRRGVFKGKSISENASEVVISNQNVAKEIVSDGAPVHDILAFYAEVAVSRSGSRSALREQLLKMAAKSSAVESSTESKANQVLAILRKNKTATSGASSVTESDDQVYFRRVAQVIADN